MNSDTRLPGVLTLPENAPAHCEIALRLQNIPGEVRAILDEKQTWQNCFTSENRNELSVPYLQIRCLGEAGYFRLNYNDGTEFVVNRAGTQIYVTACRNQTLEDLVTYLVGPLLGFVLRLHGITCLHASAVTVDGKALAFTADTNSGKSTLVAAFARMGYPVLSDNMLPVIESDNGYLALSAYPHVRLRAGAVKTLFGSPEALPLIESAIPDWDKRYLDLDGKNYHFQVNPIPLAMIYELGERTPDERAPFIEAVPVEQRLRLMESNTYKNYMLDSSMRAEESARLAQMLEKLPMRRAVSHTDLDRIFRLCEVVLADYHQAAG